MNMNKYTLRIVTSTQLHTVVRLIKTHFDRHRVLDSLYDNALQGFWIDDLFIPVHKIEYVEVTKE